MSGRRAVLIAVGLGLALGFGSVLGLSGAGVAPASAASGRSATPAPAVASLPRLAAGTPGAPGGTTQISLPSGPGTGAPAVAAPTKLSGRAKVAAVIGGLLLIGVLWAFSQGYGILGGHARRRPTPRREAASDQL